MPVQGIEMLSTVARELHISEEELLKLSVVPEAALREFLTFAQAILGAVAHGSQ